jgi:hypothetical protein
MSGDGRALRARTGVVFQNPSLDAKLTAEENLVYGGRRQRPGLPCDPGDVPHAGGLLFGLPPRALPGTAARDLAVVAAFAAPGLALAVAAARRKS